MKKLLDKPSKGDMVKAQKAYAKQQRKLRKEDREKGISDLGSISAAIRAAAKLIRGR